MSKLSFTAGYLAHRRECQVLRIQYEKELSASHVTTQTKFNYAWGLVKSPQREHQVEGVRLLQGAYRYSFRPSPVINTSNLAEIYRAEPTRRRECLYYLALGHYKMGNYEEARRFNCQITLPVVFALGYTELFVRSSAHGEGTDKSASTEPRYSY